MNEELMREIVSVLRVMKDGSPAAWEALLQQRVAYCWMCAVPSLLAAVACAWMASKSWKIAAPELRKDHLLEQSDTPMFGGIIGAILFSAGTILFAVVGVACAAEAVAPLGRVLEVLR